MYKRMLVLLDGSELAETVFSYAQELAGRLSLDLDLLHVCSPEESEQIPMRLAYVEHMAEKLRNQSEEIRARSGHKPNEKRIQARGKVIVGYPADEILKYADENAIDIIMLATHGRSGIRRWGLGSVADKVIHEARAPVWLVPAQLHEAILYDSLPRRSILIPLDGSKLAEEVIPYVQDLIEQRGAETEVLLVNVIKPQSKLSLSPGEVMGEDATALRTSGEVYLNRIVKRLKAAGLNAHAEQLIGDPAEEIVRLAAQRQPRLIAVSTHGRSGFSRFVFGSVTENLLRRLQKTPLFLVRPQTDLEKSETK